MQTDGRTDVDATIDTDRDVDVPGFWDDTWDEPEVRPTPRRWWLVAAAAPWLVVLAVFLRPDGAAPSSPSAGAGAGGGDRVTDAADSPAADRPVPDGRATRADPAGGETPLGAAADQDAAARTAVDAVIAAGTRSRRDLGGVVTLAAVAARAWVTGVGPTLAAGDLTGHDGLYLEHLLLEGVDHPSPGAAVVTFATLVLHAEDGAYDGAEARRVAVPVVLDEGAGPTLAGEPWWLDAATVEHAPVQATDAVEDPERLADAGAALSAAGYAEVAVESLARTDGWPWIVTFTAQPPAGDTPRRRTLWLRPDQQRGFVVAGDIPPPPTTMGTP